MSEERLRVLQMLSEGKISVEEAERLLKVVDSPGADDTKRVDEHRAHASWDDFRSTIRSSMPDLKRVVVEAMPDVDRIVTEATASIPDLGDMFEEFTRNMSSAFHKWKTASEFSSTSSHPPFDEIAERDLEVAASIAPGTTVVLDNPRGDICVAGWDREEVRARVHLVAHATSPSVAAKFVEAVKVEIAQGASGETRIELILPEYGEIDGMGPCRLNFALTMPETMHLCLCTANGILDIPRIDGNATLGNRHGKTKVGFLSGDLALDQSHGKARIGKVGESVRLKSRHGSVSIDAVAGSADAALSHSATEIGFVGQNAKLEASHGKLSLKGVGGDCSVTIEHGPLDVANIGGSLAVVSSHGPVALKKVTGNVNAVNEHGPLSLKDVGGDAVCSTDHGPVAIQDVKGEANVKSDHGPISLRRVGVSAAVHSDRGPVSVDDVKGRLAVHGNRAPVAINNPGGEVLVQSSRGGITLTTARPLTSPCTLTSDRGNIRLSVPPESNLDVQGYVRRGSVQTDLPLDVTVNRENGQSIMGKLGQGNVPLRIEVERGHLSLNAS